MPLPALHQAQQPRRPRAAPPHALIGALICAAICATADAAPLSDGQPPLEHRIDAAVTRILARTGVPSASIAVVRDSTLVYAKAYGQAEIAPPRAAASRMRYALGSISKEFTAAALLILQESGKLSLDDAAGKWQGGLGPSAGVTIRALLSHTSGIRDFWPQDYDPPQMLAPVSPAEILDRYASQPLDFVPGTAWQYSNTGYTAAGLIVERCSGEPLFRFLQERIFTPLGMTSVVDFDAGPLPPDDAVGYMRYALGPVHPARKEGRGWLFGAGELAMTAPDLARWDIALIRGEVLSAKSRLELTTETRLANGAGTGYALGLDVELLSGRRVLKHGGEVGGFTSENRIYPDDARAIVVLTNQDATDASRLIADAIAEQLFVADSPRDRLLVATAKTLFRQLQSNALDASLLTPNARTYFGPQARADFRASLAPLGKPTSFALKRSAQRGGFSTYVFEIGFAHRTLNAVLRAAADGRVEQFTVSAD